MTVEFSRFCPACGRETTVVFNENQTGLIATCTCGWSGTPDRIDKEEDKKSKEPRSASYRKT